MPRVLRVASSDAAANALRCRTRASSSSSSSVASPRASEEDAVPLDFARSHPRPAKPDPEPSRAASTACGASRARSQDVSSMRSTGGGASRTSQNLRRSSREDHRSRSARANSPSSVVVVARGSRPGRFGTDASAGTGVMTWRRWSAWMKGWPRAGSSSGSGSSARVGRARARGRGRVETAAREAYVERGEVIAGSEPTAEEGDAVVEGFAVRLVVHHLVERGAAGAGVHHHRAGRDRDARGRGEGEAHPPLERPGAVRGDRRGRRRDCRARRSVRIDARARGDDDRRSSRGVSRAESTNAARRRFATRVPFSPEREQKNERNATAESDSSAARGNERDRLIEGKLPTNARLIDRAAAPNANDARARLARTPSAGRIPRQRQTPAAILSFSRPEIARHDWPTTVIFM